MRKVGLIGLGAMGQGMAQSLRRAGEQVHVYDVRPEACAAFAAEGGVACASPAEVAAQCEVVISVVVNAAQTEQVLFGPGGAADAMARGSLFVMCSTVDPNWSMALEDRLAARGLLYLDAPISGGAAKAASGQMTMMTAGRPEAYDRAGKLLEAMAAKVYRLGDRAGNGSKVKIINQLLAGVHIAAAAEALALGERAGLDPRVLLEIYGSSAAGSWMLNNRGPRMLMDDPPVTSAVDIFVKDLGIVLDAGHAARAPLFLAAAAHQLFLAASGMGLGKADDALVIEAYRALGPKA